MMRRRGRKKDFFKIKGESEAEFRNMPAVNEDFEQKRAERDAASISVSH